MVDVDSKCRKCMFTLDSGLGRKALCLRFGKVDMIGMRTATLSILLGKEWNTLSANIFSFLGLVRCVS